MRTVKCTDGTVVTYCDYVDDYINAMKFSDYIVVSQIMDVCYEDRVKLQKQGFVFADRAINMQFRLPNDIDVDISDKQKNSAYSFDVSTDWDVNVVLNIVENYFENDSRFSVGVTNETRKKELIRNYLEYLLFCNTLSQLPPAPDNLTDGKNTSVGKYFATLMHNGSECIGVNIWLSSQEGARIMLGAVHPSYLNRGVSIFLYKHTLQAMRNVGINRISEWVYSSNVNSLNLHSLLFQSGYKYGKCRDVWIWSKNI
ncbi:GNAT family N-acetyltransferase [Butyrivibrio sp. AD3002]|uniref:GNAT family N-acetyltransferase n=1 Tax=Butyrivibrio sp. AD3002 TaxID=1280670 RepID=UPI0003B71144|nr:GNAT family N-acetyltransferase [Butyrivibrio sp. AD3002]